MHLFWIITLLLAIILILLFLALPFTPAGRERIRNNKLRYSLGLVVWIVVAIYLYGNVQNTSYSKNTTNLQKSQKAISKESSSTQKESSSHYSDGSLAKDLAKSESHSYQNVSYNDLDSNSDELNGKDIAITGTVSKVHKEDGSYVLIVSMDNNQAENVMVAVDGSSVPKSKKISKGDQLTINGTGGGKQSAPNELTDGNNIPYVDCSETIEFQ